ncbi:FecCD family ABC transporter permease [Sinomicrobium weinanense]|uniref:Iron ABC transporter permease n=1 Tax=Sinomicrobium weinanense TaxID=2842200 RepID=A0A926JT39_9FLAO|nr:iron ABC transporter permease [Sinomicrobium weinanense]MBC9796701.1 iron ABC transporter permease [Sinomicrobium weinanense]MBU3123024.1 iron ABC transporter permease [Sinomicrobium weinanense]
MRPLRSYKLPFLLFTLLLVFCFFVNISLGSVYIPLKQIISVLFNGETEKQAWDYIILNYRIPKAVTAILTGSGLAVSGLLMQTLFRNPLAGPFVLGISSGASLGVALLIMGASTLGITVFLSNVSLAVAATAGSFLVLLAVISVSIKVRDTMAILIIGLMFGSITSAVVSVLSYFSSAEKLQQYIFWSFGSLGNLGWNELLFLFLLVLFGIAMSIFSLKSLNSLLLGENYARSLGTDIRKSRLIIIFATSILAGGITAFAGPIAFVGLAVPHLTRQVFNTTNHKVLLPAVILYGAILMLICDTIAQWPASEFTLPINAITSIVGAPVVIWLLVRKRKMIF